MIETDAKTHRLRDGRLIGYAEYGDPNGTPWFFFHGSGDCRLLLEPLAGAALRAGVRLLAPDRPGIGLSEPDPGRTFLSWPADVAELADALSIGRFVVVGGGGGAVHALACALQIPSRLLATIISSCAPPHLEDMLESQGDRLGVKVLRVAPWFGPWVFGKRAAKVRTSPNGDWARRLAANHGEDLVFYEAPGRQQSWQRMQLEAYRQGSAGVAQEMNLLARSWGFVLADVTTKVYLRQGDDAHLLAPAAHSIASALPDCDARFIPGGGMLWLLSHPDELFQEIAPLLAH